MINHKIPETLTWKAPTHIQPIRSYSWYLFFTLISLTLLGYAVYTKSIMTGITFILIIFVVLIFSSQSSSEITYHVNKTNITAGNSIYPYKVIKKFWIIYNPPEVKTLNFETTAYLKNKIVIQLGKQDPVELKLVLSQYLPEDLEMEESITESLARKLKI